MVLALTTVPLALTSTNASGSASSMAARRAAPRDGLLLTRRFLPVPHLPTARAILPTCPQRVTRASLRAEVALAAPDEREVARRRTEEPVTAHFIPSLPTSPNRGVTMARAVPRRWAEPGSRGTRASQRATWQPCRRSNRASTGRPAQVARSHGRWPRPPYIIVHIVPGAAGRRGPAPRGPLVQLAHALPTSG